MSTKNITRAKVDALLALLNSAAQEAIAEYEKTGDVPSTELAHPLDSQPPTFALKNAVRILEGACEQLCTTLAPPAHTLLNRVHVQYEPACIGMAIEAKVADILVGHPDGLPVTDIAKKTGIDKDKLKRILRFLAAKHCFHEVRTDVFANNRLSLFFVSSTGVSETLLLATTFGPKDKLYAYLTDPEYGRSDAPEKCAFMYNLRDEGIQDLFEYLKRHPEKEQFFASALNGLSKIMGDGASIVKDFPWKDMLPGSTFCDIGSGGGAITLELAKAHPHLKLTLHDQPQVLELARSIWKEGCPEALEEQRVDFVPLDFFKEGPVKDQDIYYMRQIVHDWQDDVNIGILKKVRGSMNLQSRLLINDCILYHHDLSGSPDNVIAPEPLLPNYGAGNIRQYYKDITMMVMNNSRERSLDELRALGVEAGLEFVKVWHLAETPMVEFKIAA